MIQEFFKGFWIYALLLVFYTLVFSNIFVMRWVSKITVSEFQYDMAMRIISFVIALLLTVGFCKWIQYYDLHS